MNLTDDNKTWKFRKLYTTSCQFIVFIVNFSIGFCSFYQNLF